MPFVDALRAHADKCGQHLFLSDDEKSYTYAEALSQVCKIAHYLQQHGVQCHDRVLLCFQNRASFIFSYLACGLLAAVPVPFDFHTRAHVIRDMIAITDANHLVLDPDRPELHSLPCNVLCYPTLDTNATKLWQDVRSSVAHLLLTSGTTGRPKAVTMSIDNVFFSVSSMINWAHIAPGDREIITLRLTHSFGLGMLYAHLLLGNHVTITSSARDLSAVLDYIALHNITGLAATPATIKILVQHYGEDFYHKSQHLRYLITNTCPLEKNVIEQVLANLPKLRFYMYYGLTEASRSTVNAYHLNHNKLESVGKSIAGVDVKVRNAEQGIGQIYVKGPNVMTGYWKEDNDNCFDEEGYFATGDLGSIDSDGFIILHGRLKEQINVDGLKCYPEEIEAILLQHSAVEECCVIGVPDALSHQKIVAAVVTDKQDDLKQLGFELQRHCKKQLEIYKIPKQILFVSEIPKTEAGKVQRLKLRASLLQEGEKAS